MPSAQLGRVADSQFSGLPGQSHRLFGPVAIGQINPQGLDLPGRIALKQIGPPRTAFGPVTGHDDRRIESGRFPQIEVEPIFLKPARSGCQIDRPHLAGFLSVELVAGDATEPLTADQFVPHVAEERAWRDFRNAGRFQMVDAGEQLHQVSHLRLTVLRHAGIEITARTFAVQQHIAEALRRELGPHMVQGRRQTACISQTRFGPREQPGPLRRNATHTRPFMAGNAVEGDERFLNALGVRPHGCLGPRQCLGDVGALITVQVVPRPPADRLAQAPLPRPQTGPRRSRCGANLKIIVTLGAPACGELLPTLGRQSRIHRERFKGRNGLAGHRQQGFRQGIARETGPLHLEGKLRAMPGVEIRELDGSPSRFQFLFHIPLLHPATIAGFLNDERMTIDRQGTAVHRQEEPVFASRGDLHPTLVANGCMVPDLAEALEGKVANLPSPFGPNFLAIQPLPDLAPIQRVSQGSGHPRALQQIVRDTLRILRTQTQVRHPARRTAQVRLAQKS